MHAADTAILENITTGREIGERSRRWRLHSHIVMTSLNFASDSARSEPYGFPF